MKKFIALGLLLGIVGGVAMTMVLIQPRQTQADHKTVMPAAAPIASPPPPSDQPAPKITTDKKVPLKQPVTKPAAPVVTESPAPPVVAPPVVPTPPKPQPPACTWQGQAKVCVSQG